MVEVTYVVQSYFNLMVHAKIQEASNKIYDRNKMLAYADSMRGGFSDDSERIRKDAAERTKLEIENGGFENFSIHSHYQAVVYGEIIISRKQQNIWDAASNQFFTAQLTISSQSQSSSPYWQRHWPYQHPWASPS